jgi:S1-C subfamily serine protease
MQDQTGSDPGGDPGARGPESHEEFPSWAPPPPEYGTPGWNDPHGGSGWNGPPGGYGALPPPPGPPRRRKGRAVVYGLVAVLAAGLGAGAAVGLTGKQNSPSSTVSSGSVPGPHNNATGGPDGLSQAYVAGKIEPGVVDIDAAIQYSGGTSSEGTGMIINGSGLVLTNNHVISGARVIKVTSVTTGKAYRATVLGYDAAQDVALLQIPGATGLKAVSVGNSSQVRLGTPVLALGNAEGQGGLPKLAAGIINSLNKTITPTDESTGTTETLHGMLQTSAQIVSGDSGGPLANAAGQVIGMDTANASDSGGTGAVLGYAIPINRALAVARQIAAGQGSATVQIGVPGFLGVLVARSSSSSPRQQAREQRQQQSGGGSQGAQGPRGGGCTDNSGDTSVPSVIAPASTGALVDGVLCGTPAATAGLAGGDVVTSVNGRAVTTPNSLTTLMNAFRPGARVSLSWETTDGRHVTRTLVLAAAPAR